MELVERTLEFDVERMISGRVNSFKRCAIGFFRSSRVLERSQLITALTKSGICETSQPTIITLPSFVTSSIPNH